MNEHDAPVAELSGAQVRHCTAPFAEQRASAFDGLETLPYGRLGGPGFERLCFEILLSRGYKPRFFGRSGQAQFEVDLLGTKDGRTEVFQCKNLAKAPSAAQLEDYLHSFEQQWLGAANLPRPQRYVICCPAMLRDSGVDADWQQAQAAFEARTGGVLAELWHRDLLDGWLKKLPDVVADLFSDRHAEAFCDLDDWVPDLFVPLRKGAAGDLRLNRYLRWRDEGRLYLHPAYEDRFTDALGRSPVVLVRGLPGTGKTFTALAVAEGYHQGTWRSYFLDVADESLTQHALYDGIRRRLGRPSIFILENCHENLDAVAHALRRLEPELRSDRVRVLCLTRWIPTADESRSDDHDFFEDLESRDAVQELTNDDAILTSMVRFQRPDLDRLSGERLKRLFALSGRDLLVLDEVLSRIESPRDIEGLTPSILFDRLRGQYFGGRTADELPATRRLAALAQFELRPRADLFPVPESELHWTESLCVKAGRPPRWYFLHSSAAELALHALWSGMGVTDPIEIACHAAQDVIAYFAAAAAPGVQPPVSTEALAADLLQVLRNRQTLAGYHAEQALKAAVLDSEPIRSLLPRLQQAPGFGPTVSAAAFMAHRCRAKHAMSYAEALSNSLAVLANDQVALAPVLSALGIWLRTLKIAAPELHELVCAKFDAYRMLATIIQNGTVVELFKIVQHASAGLADKLVGALDEARVDRLIASTVDQRRSIGTLNFTLFELRKDPERRKLGERLEEAIGVTGFWKLLLGAGSVGPLVDLMRDMSTEFRTRFLAAAYGHSQDDWTGLLGRGDVFQLCEMLADCPEMLSDAVGGERLNNAITAVTPVLLAESDWYARSTGAKRLDAAQPSGPRNAALAVLDIWLADVEVASLSLSTLRQAVNALALLSERRPASRVDLAARLWELLPAPDSWVLDHKQDMALPRMLLGLVASPEFPDTDATRIFEACVGCLVPSFLARCRTVDIVWTLWALFALARRRWDLTPSAFAARLPAELVGATRDALKKGADQKTNADERCAQFCLLGLLSLLNIGGDSASVEALCDQLGKNPDATAWSLCANRPFVPAWLALRGVDAVRSLRPQVQEHFLKRLASAAEEYPERDPATEYLLDDVKRRQRSLGNQVRTER